MSTDLFEVEVVQRSGSTVRFRLHPRGESSTPFAGPSFALMLIADPAAPGADAYDRWVESGGDALDPIAAIERVAVTPAERAPEVSVTVSDPAMLAHLSVGARWGSTAYDELGDGLPYEGAPLAWTRSAQRSPQPVQAEDAGFHVIERRDRSVVLDVHTKGELPAPDPEVWVGLLRYSCSRLIRARPARAREYIAAVRTLEIDGERDLERGRVTLGKDLRLRTRGVLRARYELDLADEAVLSGKPVDSAWMYAWLPDATLVPLRDGGSSVEEFEELVELGALEGPETVLEMLASGLEEGREVSLAALSRARELGPEAAPLSAGIARLVGSVDDEVAIAAIDAARAVATPELAVAIAWARKRRSRAVAAAAG